MQATTLAYSGVARARAVPRRPQTAFAVMPNRLVAGLPAAFVLDDAKEVIHTAPTESLLRPPTMTTERIRTTISLSPEAHAVFKRMAEAGNMSVSRCMGDWLGDTADAAEMLTLKMEEAKRAPMRVMREMRAMVAGLGLAVDEVEDEVRLRSAKRSGGSERAATAPRPPSGNTGVLVPPLPKSKSISPRGKKV